MCGDISQNESAHHWKREAVAATLRASETFGAARRTQTRFLLTGILHCASCGANFIARVAHSKRFGKYFYYGCAHHARRGDTACSNRTLLPQTEVERELLDILQQQLLTQDTLDRLLKAVNAKLRAQAAASRPRVAEVRKALAQVDRQIANYTRAVARGEFASLETALGVAEQRRATLQAELAQLDGKQQTPTHTKARGRFSRWSHAHLGRGSTVGEVPASPPQLPR